MKRILMFAGWALAILAASSAVGLAQTGPKLSHRGKQLLAEARLQGRETVMLLIAATPGATSSVVSGLENLGGVVRYQRGDLGYVRVLISSNQVGAAARLTGVEAVDLDEIIPLEDPRPRDTGSVNVAPPDATPPPQNPYMPTRDIGAPQFVAANPNWDGRGVTVGILDTGVTLDHPSLLTTSTNQRKIVDWVTFTDPLGDDDPTWVNMQAQVAGSQFSHQGVTYTAPGSGSYRIGLFNERDSRLGGEVGKDVNRDGNPAGSKGIFAVLWDTTRNLVYVDTNQNNSFVDEMAMTDYRERYDVNYFGADNPATPVAERMPFVVQTDGKGKFINIGIVSGAHGSHVAGIVAAKGLFGGTSNGAAPGARIVSVRACLFVAGCTASALIEGMICVTKQSNVDVVNMSIGGLPALNDGNNARAILYNRLIDQSKAQFFFSAGNSGPGINTVGDPSVASRVVSVGAYVHKDTWLSNYGADAVKEDGLFPFSSRGPSEDGGFKPNLVAPGAAVSTTPMWQPGGPVAGTYALPPGYSMFNGTSMSAPQATGGAALLISAARQWGAQYKPDQLRKAIYSSARYLPFYGAHEQGNGLLQVGAAWNLLRTNLKTDDVITSAPVRTILSQFLSPPDQGAGIYEREGWAAGMSEQRVITFVRTHGPGSAIAYNLGWVGNDGTFSTSGSTINLPLNTPVTLPVTVSPGFAGVHSAILNLDDPGSLGVEYQVLNTVVAANQFTAAGNYQVTRNGSADRPDKTTFFFNVLPGAGALRGDVTVEATGRVRFLRFHPWGLPFDNLNTTGYQTGGTISRSAANPTPGVWEFTVDTSRTSPAAAPNFTVGATILGASVSPNPDLISSATIGVPIARSYTLTNLLGAFTGRAVGTAFSSARRGVFTIANAQQQQYPIVVTPGSTRLQATIGSPTDPAADLDLYVFNCTSGSCVLAGASADGDSEESVTINNPAAGAWLVLIDAFAVPAGSTGYNYVDSFLNPAFGSVSVTDANALRPAGASWVAPASVTANAAPAAGRVLLGNVEVRTDTNVRIGSGDVIVETVTP